MDGRGSCGRPDVGVASARASNPVGSPLGAEHRLMGCLLSVTLAMVLLTGSASATNGEVGPGTPCIPAYVTDRQALDVATAFLQRKPAIRHAGAADIVAQALADAFPCPPAPPSIPAKLPAPLDVASEGRPTEPVSMR
jgi:hypothetical protein